MPNNEWRGTADTVGEGIWSLVTPTGRTLIQIKFDHDLGQYRVAQHGGAHLGRDWGVAVKKAEEIATGADSRKGRK